jgi:dihydropyrimidine dehydrogenase (NADP+)
VILPQILIEERNPTTPQANTMESLTLRTSPATASPLQRRIPRPRATSVRASASAGEPDLSVCVNGLKMPNPFVIGSGPPGTNYTVMKRAFDEGWGGVIAKTVSHSLSLSLSLSL